MDIATGTETVLHTFCSNTDYTDGSGGNGGVTLGDRNTVFGTTPLGGKNNGGTVFQLNAKTGKETVIYSFCKEADCADGQGPDAALVQNGASLIGTTSSASNLGGVIFQVNPDKSETVLHTFCQDADCTDGSLPVGVLVDPAGTIFGVTSMAESETTASSINSPRCLKRYYKKCRRHHLPAFFLRSLPNIEPQKRLCWTCI